jgi:RNA polymerase sigma-70 factor
LLATFDARPEVIDELLQQVRHRLLVGPNPRIRTYNGKGTLQGWLRKVAQTLAIDTIRANVGRERRTRRLGQDSVYADLLHSAPPPLPDEHLDRARYGHVVRQVFCQAVQNLSNDRRRLLQLYYVAGMSIDQLGLLYSVDRSTAARRVVRVVQDVQHTLRVELVRRLGSRAAAELSDWEIILDRDPRGSTNCPDLLRIGDVPPASHQPGADSTGTSAE